MEVIPPFDTEFLVSRVSDLEAKSIDEKDLAVLKLRYPREIAFLERLVTAATISLKTPWIVRLSWKGQTRTPLGLQIGEQIVTASQSGVLFDQEGYPIPAYYLRLLDDSGPDSSDPRQDMLVIGGLG